MSAQSTRRAPPALLLLIGTMVSCPFLLLAFAISPLSGTWLKFVILALPFVALLPLWRWVGPHSNAVTSPLPRRATTGAGPSRSITLVGSRPQLPLSITASTE